MYVFLIIALIGMAITGYLVQKEINNLIKASNQINKRIENIEKEISVRVWNDTSQIIAELEKNISSIKKENN